MVSSASESSSSSHPDLTSSLKTIKKSKKKERPHKKSHKENKHKHRKSKKEKKKHKRKHTENEVAPRFFPITVPDLLGHGNSESSVKLAPQSPNSFLAAVDAILVGNDSSMQALSSHDPTDFLLDDLNLEELKRQKEIIQLSLEGGAEHEVKVIETIKTGKESKQVFEDASLLIDDDSPGSLHEVVSLEPLYSKSINSKRSLEESSTSKGYHRTTTSSQKKSEKKRSRKDSDSQRPESKEKKSRKELQDHNEDHETPSKKLKTNDSNKSKGSEDNNKKARVKDDESRNYRHRTTDTAREKDHGSSSHGRKDYKSSGANESSTYRQSASPSRNYNNRDRDTNSRNDSSRSGGGIYGRDRRYDNVKSVPRDMERDRGRDIDRRGDYRSSKDYRSYSRERDSRRSRPSDVIDKAKLLEIARRNATLLMKQGVLPTDIFSRDQIMAIKAGGKSVEELTSYCRKLARKDSQTGTPGDDSDDGEDSDADEDHFIHHPFVVKDRPMPQITLNIRNAIPLPVRTPQELAIENAVRKTQFPVSSGAQHRYKELEWKVVDKDEDKKDKEKKTKDDQSKALVVLESSKSQGVSTTSTAVQNSSKATAQPNISEIQECDSSSMVTEPTSENSEPEKQKDTDTGISVEPPMLPHVDISSVISARLKAMRALKENPDSEEAKKLLDGAVEEMNQWAQAKALEPKFLTVSDLQTGPQAWAKRDQLKNAKEVASGMGMHLLQKMGWRPGEGLGKNKEGTTEPLALDVKTDKKGLTAQADLKLKGPQSNVSMLYDLAGKHPVSALMELCTKRRWGPPSFELCFEHGPPHQKQFVFKVIVNGVEYQPCIATNNKKLAKANSAAFCLQSLGLLKTNPAPGPTENLQTVPPTEENMQPHLLQTVPYN